MRYVLPSEFAEAVNVSERTAQRAFESACKGATWKGHALPVVQLHGTRGGKGGTRYALVRNALPAALRSLFPADAGEPVTPQDETRYALATDRLRVIEPILPTPRRSASRAQAVAAAATRPHKIGDDVKPVAVNTLRDWLRDYKHAGFAGLMTRHRSDRGTARVQVTRRWDRDVGLAEDTREAVRKDLDAYAGGLVLNSDASGRRVIYLASKKLFQLSREAGSPLSDTCLARACVLNGKWVKRFDHLRPAYQINRDHKAWQDRQVSRIRRELTERPMQILMGDVHYVDLLAEDEGAPIRVRLIAWMDLSSHFIWTTPVFWPQGKGIRQEDAAQSLAQVVMHPFGGLPEAFYLDNGSEYAELGRAMDRLCELADQAGGFKVHRAKP